jgi:hypothetical protein
MNRIICLIYIFSFFSCNTNSNVRFDTDSSLINPKDVRSARFINYNIDSLKKYSYFILAGDPRDNYWDQATGFFIRKNNKLFFVSALHVFAGMTGQAIYYKKDINFPDTLRSENIGQRQQVWILQNTNCGY